MESQSRSEASRANGAKSRGPSTPEGKARSSQNALKHGLTAQFEALPGESQEAFDAFLEAHLAQYQPVGDVETELVHTLASTLWRLRRVPTLEFNVFDNELVQSEKEIKKEFSHIDDPGRVGFVFRKLADSSQALTLLIRYESSLTRTHDRVFKHLIALQKLRNEPSKSLKNRQPPPDPPAVVRPRVPASSPTSTPQSRANGTAMRKHADKPERQGTPTAMEGISLARNADGSQLLPSGYRWLDPPQELRNEPKGATIRGS